MLAVALFLQAERWMRAAWELHDESVDRRAQHVVGVGTKSVPANRPTREQRWRRRISRTISEMRASSPADLRQPFRPTARRQARYRRATSRSARAGGPGGAIPRGSRD